MEEALVDHLRPLRGRKAQQVGRQPLGTRSQNRSALGEAGTCGRLKQTVCRGGERVARPDVGQFARYRLPLAPDPFEVHDVLPSTVQRGVMLYERASRTTFRAAGFEEKNTLQRSINRACTTVSHVAQ